MKQGLQHFAEELHGSHVVALTIEAGWAPVTILKSLTTRLFKHAAFKPCVFNIVHGAIKTLGKI